MSPIESAMLQQQEEVDSYGQGGAGQPTSGTPAWFLLRAAAIGLAHLRRTQALGIESDPAACEGLYRASLSAMKAADPL